MSIPSSQEQVVSSKDLSSRLSVTSLSLRLSALACSPGSAIAARVCLPSHAVGNAPHTGSLLRDLGRCGVPWSD